jgi:eukaryotic-like serine/threonine-protein kinase
MSDRLADTWTQPSDAGSRPAPTVGDTLGNWRLTEQLGEGGMGQVFVGKHVQLGRRSAIKVLRPELSQDPEAVRRFFQEARVVNRIVNDHIIQIHDFCEGPVAYFVMDLLEGRDLARARLEEGPLTLERIVLVASQVAEGLRAVHASKVVHRDLKPENVFLSNQSSGAFVKILDFGVAKLGDSTMGARRGGDVGTLGPPKTAFGVVLGTPEYMSPEQAVGDTVDARTDVYALGLMIYWMITDRIPHRSDSFGEMAVRRSRDEPPPLPATTVAGELLPPSLAALVMGCLERDPDKRIPSMDIFLRTLETVRLDELVEEAPPPVPSRRVSNLPLPFAIGLAAVVGLLAWWFGRQTSAPPPAAVAPPAVVVAAPPKPQEPAAIPPIATKPVAAPLPPVPEPLPPVPETPVAEPAPSPSPPAHAATTPTLRPTVHKPRPKHDPEAQPDQVVSPTDPEELGNPFDR